MCDFDFPGYGFGSGAAWTYLFKTRGKIYGIHIASYVSDINFFLRKRRIKNDS